ncbi:MCE family protein [Streptomyces boninensis]|uniref:MCE family protein n=1 Tax=Streptomyces boninensis TaxID=2039455 RepID=UPI003B21FB25
MAAEIRGPSLGDRFADALGDLWGRRLMVIIVVLALLGTGAAWGAGKVFGSSDSKKITAYFDRAVSVHEGSDVRVLGVKVGTVDDIEPRGKRVKVELSVDQGVKVPRRVQAVVVAPSVVAGRFVQLSPPFMGGQQFPDGGVIPASDTATPVEVDELMKSVTDLSEALGPKGANKNGALSDLLNTGAANLKGNGKAFGETIKNLGGAASVLNGNSGDLVKTVQGLQKFTTMLKKNDKGVQTAAKQLSDVSKFLSDDKENLAAALKDLGTALGQVKGFIQNNRGRLKSNVDKLAKLTQSVVNQRRSVAEALDVLPLAAQNIDAAYNPRTNTLDGRANINELTMTRGGASLKSGTLEAVPETRRSSLPALPLPTVGDVYGTPAKASAKGGDGQ